MVFAILDSLGFEITEIVSGTAKGVDSLGALYAEEKSIELSEFPANWDKFGLSAGHLRNEEMANYVGSNGCLVLIWDGKSKGSKSMLRYANTIGLKIEEWII